MALALRTKELQITKKENIGFKEQPRSQGLFRGPQTRVKALGTRLFKEV